MPALHTYDYAVVRLMPRVERGEFINAGIILSCDVQRFLESRIELDEPALRCLDPQVDMDGVRAALAAIPLICSGGAGAGPLRHMSARERFHWLVAPRSTIVQTSPVHTGRCADLRASLEHLVMQMVRRAR